MLTLVAAAVLAAAPTPTPSFSGLGMGKAEFAITGNDSCREHFHRGLLALHSFWYDIAKEEFVAAETADPACQMAIWGEAMTYNHAVWTDQDAGAARAALAKLGDLSKLSPVEREWIDAVKILYGDGTKTERDRAYADAMDRMHRSHPDDLEAETFDALAKLGLSQDLGVNTRLQMEAGALALDAYGKNPNHPGAAHYVIHSFDDPDHAILALPAARRYAQIAPDAPHARHMPAHIFVQLGMWPEAIESNVAAVRVSREFYAQRKGEEWKFDTHSGRWLMDVYLEEGRRKPADETLALDATVVAHTRVARAEDNYAETVLAWLTETGEWNRAEELLAPLSAEKVPDLSAPAAPPAAAAPTPAPAPKPASSGIAKGCAAHESASFGPPFAELEVVAIAEVRGYAASAKGDAKAAKKQADLIHASIAKVEDPSYKAQIEDYELMLRAAMARAAGRNADAATLLRKSIEIEKTLPPPSGPAEGLVSAERLGEVLLAAGKPAEAADAFALAMAQHQGRARSILGAARAEKALGHSAKAAELYGRVAAIWKDADADWPGVAEARAATAHADAR